MEIQAPSLFNQDPLKLLYLLKEKNRAQDFFNKINKDNDDVVTIDELQTLFRVSFCTEYTVCTFTTLILKRYAWQKLFTLNANKKFSFHAKFNENKIYFPHNLFKIELL